MRKIAIALVMLLATSAFAATSSTLAPTTTNNDDSCDIDVQPSATLLLPYFEVDFKNAPSTAVTTLFTVQNVSPMPQIAQVTLWTDWGYPALTFPMFLTGYDVQPINLYDVFARAVIAPGPYGSAGTSIHVTVPVNPTPGTQPGPNDSNPNFLPSATTNCANAPGVFSAQLLTDLQLLFTTGKTTGASNLTPNCGTAFGGTHTSAIGYVTIDVAATCYAGAPAGSDYFQHVILYDNVLTGDYQHLFPGKYALGGPLVHIRAIPEGGAAGSTPGTSLPYTFYDRMTSNLTLRDTDRRQPLPSEFAPRYISGGTGAFNTSFKIWREAVSGANPTTCSQYTQNSDMQIAEMVRFDEHENATVVSGGPLLGAPVPPPPGLPVTSMVPAGVVVFPPMSTSGDVAGWIFMNLNNGGSTAYSVGIGPGGVPRDFVTKSSTNIGLRQSQAWVLTSMYADPTYATEATALALGNGCSPSPRGGAQIGPAANANP